MHHAHAQPHNTRLIHFSSRNAVLALTLTDRRPDPDPEPDPQVTHLIHFSSRNAVLTALIALAYTQVDSLLFLSMKLHERNPNANARFVCQVRTP